MLQNPNIRDDLGIHNNVADEIYGDHLKEDPPASQSHILDFDRQRPESSRQFPGLPSLINREDYRKDSPLNRQQPNQELLQFDCPAAPVDAAFPLSNALLRDK